VNILKMTRPIEILLVEDNPGDVLLIQESLKKMLTHNHLHVAEDGVEAMDYLLQKGQFTSAPKPDLILLDLNLPRKDGRELLKEIKSEEHFKRIPVVVLTSSDAEDDIKTAYDLHANCYITKPVDFKKFSTVIASLEEFWFSVVTLPDK
jgi:chemotaxis family two-component system response regulator Rcp1